MGEDWRKGHLTSLGWSGARQVAEEVLPSRSGFGDADVLSVDLNPTSHCSSIRGTGGGHVILVINV